MNSVSRRTATRLLASISAGTLIGPGLLAFQSSSMNQRAIPSSGELLPVVGLGTWQVFDVGADPGARKPLKEVLHKMRELGGKLIDSSPMYGRAEEVIGELTTEAGLGSGFFYATKVWTSGEQRGTSSMESSLARMKRPVMDLMQVHNLLDWQTHIKTLRAWKDGGKIRYWGITHYSRSAHDTLGSIIKSEKPDFVQFNYSLAERHAESRLLHTAREQGTAVIVNRPYEGGELFRKVRGKELPPWAGELGIRSWGQFFLKYILADEAVHCVIPGTSNPVHLADNMQAGYGSYPSQADKEKMVHLLASF